MNSNQKKGIGFIIGGVLSIIIIPRILSIVGLYNVAYYLQSNYIIYVIALILIGLGIKSLMSNNITKPIYILIFTISLVLFSCKNTTKIENKNENKNESESESDTVKEIIVDWKDHWEKPNQKAELLSNPKVHYRIKECLNDTAIVVLTSFFDNPDSYSTVKSIGDINNDGIIDSIMVIPELYITADSSCDNAASIIFIDKNIPRIRVDVTCLGIDYIFPVADIDEDGIIELGKYYSSGVSRFKGLQLISLKNSEWKILGEVTFDISFEKPVKEKRIKKIGLNKFQMREIFYDNDSNVTIDIWKTFEIE